MYDNQIKNTKCMQQVVHLA